MFYRKKTSPVVAFQISYKPLDNLNWPLWFRRLVLHEQRKEDSNEKCYKIVFNDNGRYEFLIKAPLLSSKDIRIEIEEGHWVIQGEEFSKNLEIYTRSDKDFKEQYEPLGAGI